MRLSMKTDYGLRALVDLAERYGQGPVQSAEIAARQHIPEYYLDQLLIALRRAGLVRSARGPQGGHMLARPAHEITAYDVIVALEGSLAPLSCLEETQPDGGETGLQYVWRRMRDAVEPVLRSITIAELLDRQRMREARLVWAI